MEKLWITLIFLTLIVSCGSMFPLLTSPTRLTLRGVSLLTGVFLFGLAFSIYFYLGNSHGVKQRYAMERNKQVTQQLLRELNTPEKVIAKLQQRLQKDPSSAEGWFLLGRVYFSLEQFSNSVTAFAKAYALQNNNDTIAIQYAEALYFSEQQQLTPAVKNLINVVLTHDPMNEAANNLLALDAYQHHHYQQAIAYWEKLLPLHPPQSEDGKALLAAIAKAQQKILM